MSIISKDCSIESNNRFLCIKLVAGELAARGFSVSINEVDDPKSLSEVGLFCDREPIGGAIRDGSRWVVNVKRINEWIASQTKPQTKGETMENIYKRMIDEASHLWPHALAAKVRASPRLVSRDAAARSVAWAVVAKHESLHLEEAARRCAEVVASCFRLHGGSVEDMRRAQELVDEIATVRKTSTRPMWSSWSRRPAIWHSTYSDLA